MLTFCPKGIRKKNKNKSEKELIILRDFTKENDAIIICTKLFFQYSLCCSHRAKCVQLAPSKQNPWEARTCVFNVFL